ncbi:MAG: hypothetical protein Q7S96_03690 [bacterium]|nr:hypothetical protein [bacterium]
MPPFPFDAMDTSFDGEDFDPAELFPSVSRESFNAPPVSLELVRQKLRELDEHIRNVLSLMDHEVAAAPAMAMAAVAAASREVVPPKPMAQVRPVDPLQSSIANADHEAARIIEGVFDGQHMIGPDGKQYSVPANYSSKSKLVEGDILKLRITQRGAFVYKQIGPIARERRVGVLERDDLSGEFVVIVPDAEVERSSIKRAIQERSDLPIVEYKRFRILRASVTYYRGESGDEVVVLVPKGAPSTWAAVENIIKG